MLRHMSKKYKTVAVFLVENFLKNGLNVSFFMYFGNFNVFLHMLIFAIMAFWLISDVLTFAKFVEFMKRSTIRGDRYFFYFPSQRYA